MAAVHKSVIKRVRQDKIRKVRNTSYKTKIASATKRILHLAESGEKEKAREELNKVQSIIDAAGTKGILHRNTVARRVSRIARSVAKTPAK